MSCPGGGASLPQLFQLLIELAEADSNVPQALRGHFAFAEDRLNAAPGPNRDLWFKRFVDGDIVGCAWTEIGLRLDRDRQRGHRRRGDPGLAGR